MIYANAFKIGSKIEGKIKCTYAVFYNASGKAMFSLQQKAAYNGVDFKGGDDSTWDNAIVTQLTDDIYFCDCVSERYGDGAKIRGRIGLMIPMVTADTQIRLKPSISKKGNLDSGAPLVPAKLTSLAKELILAACKKFHAYKYSVYVNVINPTTGKRERRCVLETYDFYNAEAATLNFQKKYNLESKYVERVVTKAIDPRTEELLNILQNDDKVYVKACAFDWNPTNIDNASIVDPETGVDVALDISLKEAEDKMNKAKALLFTAAASNII